MSLVHFSDHCISGMNVRSIRSLTTSASSRGCRSTKDQALPTISAGDNVDLPRESAHALSDQVGDDGRESPENEPKVVEK